MLSEVVYVLMGVYGATRKDISIELCGFFEKTTCILPHREAVLKGFELFAECNLDFVDCVLAGYMFAEGADIDTFDNGLKKLLTRLSL